MFNILYVEDDVNSCNVMQIVQRMNPELMSLQIFQDSDDFEQRLLNLDPPPNVIFLDIHIMPLTGFEMLKIIRAHAEFSAVPVVAMTASVMNEEIQTLKAAGFSGVFSKPIDLDVFPEQLNKVMQGERVWYVL